MNNASYVTKQKLIWRSCRRSMLEIDMCFSRFLQLVGLDQLNDAQLSAYAFLVDCDDGDLFLLFQGNDKILDDVEVQNMVDKIRACTTVINV